MWTEIVNFFTTWLGSTVLIPIPFTQGESIDLVVLISLIVLLFSLFWILLLIKRIIDSFISIF